MICSCSGNAGRFLSLLHGCDELIGVIAVETHRCETEEIAVISLVNTCHS